MPNTPANQLYSTGTLGMPTQDGHIIASYSVEVTPDQYLAYREQGLFAGVLVKRDAIKGLILATGSGEDAQGISQATSPTFVLGALSLLSEADSVCVKVNESESFVVGDKIYFDTLTGMFTKTAPLTNPIIFGESLSANFSALNPEKMMIANSSANLGQYGNAVIARLKVPV